ncbi:MAG: SDR family oxidoreductase [Acidimicrobiia bacterium]|nr:SDR family oxidoreductase [Acidimicrobiia bacterium]
MTGRLEGRVALITGGASGIGRGCALRYAAEGAAVVVADVNGERAEEVAGEIARAGGRADSVVADTSSEASVDAMVAAAVAAFGRVDTCVAAAGISHANYVSRPAEDQVGVDRMDRDDLLVLDKALASWQRVIDVNLTGVMLTDRAVARHMVERGGGGTIVNIASVAAVTALAGSADYCVSKAGVWMLTKCLAVELARHQIRVNAVGPGYIKTSMSASSVAHQPWVDARTRETPLRRLGEPLDIANACLYLACDESSFVTGEIIFPDGGLGAAVRA